MTAMFGWVRADEWRVGTAERGQLIVFPSRDQVWWYRDAAGWLLAIVGKWGSNIYGNWERYAYVDGRRHICKEMPGNTPLEQVQVRTLRKRESLQAEWAAQALARDA